MGGPLGGTAPIAGGVNIPNGFPAPALSLQNYPIDIPIPKEAEVLPLDIPIPRGNKLAACWGRRWIYVTVHKDGNEDTVQIHWDDHSAAFDGLIHRSQLIIRKNRSEEIKDQRDAVREADVDGRYREVQNRGQAIVAIVDAGNPRHGRWQRDHAVD